MVILYCTIFLSLWTIGTVMLVNNSANPHTRWFSLFLFVTGFASFSVVLNVQVLPWMSESSLFSPEAIESVRLFSMAAWGVEYHFVPYLLLMCSLVFTRLFRRRAIIMFGLIGPVPILVYLTAVPPLYPDLHLGGHLSFRMISGAYFLTGLAIYALRYVTERNASYRKNSFRTAAALIPCVSFLYATDYIGIERVIISREGMVMTSNNMWLIIALVFAAFFIYYGMKYGFMGIKLRIEKQKMDYSMKNLTQGALILNHTIKNEVQKINYLSSRMRNSILQNDKEDMLRDLTQLDRVGEHILNMMNQIKERTGDIVLHEEEHRMADVLEYSLMALEPMLQAKQISVSKDIQCDPVILCDKSHIQEVLSNLLVNALDAIGPGNGKISISLLEAKKEVVIGVQDNGSGISNESAARMFDPFFTTKKGVGSYGLGLNYCYGVMQKHGGSIRLAETEQGKGTRMELRFPAKRVRMMKIPDRSAALRIGAI
ncbi:HAMP domain-containing sensor histidine kinase [Paenibacillus sp. LHD-117]|uniref:sensor histidine kinase n=1 Tax=Paenibacillus sp. LHD-117 TaxID=3071412 RepID=UPI0027E158F7|nr:HAMP domain-containing sensor histidine kinase [Paenibacillus sp. LHD-117]MDQ6421957.1 HAMP domain-containing sensor histidine kinase [Paenibacillus sp. LHD-117]